MAGSEEKDLKRKLTDEDETDGFGTGTTETTATDTGDSKKAKVDAESEEDSEEVDSDEVDDSDGSSEDEVDLGEDLVDDSDDEPMEDLVVDFEGVPPVEEDLGAIEGLIGQLYRGLPVNVNQLARLIVSDDILTTLLKNQDIEEPSTYGVASVINLSKPTTTISSEFANEFRTWVKQGYLSHNKCSGESSLPEILRKFEIGGNNPSEVKFGLIVAEKVVNIPTQAMWTLLNAMKDDILDEGIQFTHFFILTKYYRAENQEVPYEEYYETLSGMSSFFVDYALPKDTDTIPHNGQVGIPFRRLFVVPSTTFYQTVAAMSG